MSTRAITSAGGLLPTDLLDRVVAGDTKLAGTSPDTYGLVPGERLTDSITRSWNRLTGIWTAFSAAIADLPESETATTITRERWLRPLLDELDFHGLEATNSITIEEKDYPISHVWGGAVPVHQLGAKLPIDRRSANIPGAAKTSPHGLVQEFLNRSDEHLWAIVTNGLTLRLLRDNASLTRPAYVEFDLESMFDGEQYADFVLFWLLVDRSRFDADIPEKCWLEQWTNEAATAGTRALDRLRNGVEQAIEALGAGFVDHPGNTGLRQMLSDGDLTTADYQRQLLRVAYRLLFLLVAEARELLLDPDADEIAKARYQDFYSLQRLVDLAEVRRGGPHDDLWEAHSLVVKALSGDGQPLLGLAPLGSFLWSDESTPDLASARISNRAVLDAIRSLSFTQDADSGLDRRIDYRNLGAEELGSIYESLLELHAEVDPLAGTFALSHAAGNDRKTTGSYYTPTPLINELLDSALEPVLAEAARKPNPEAAILDLSVVDPACGSGHFLIAAANRIAHRLAMVREGGIEPAPDQVRTALRDVVSNCIHGIDINPMAVELCKISLWLEAMEPGKPLGFLDHRIVCGNSLLGATPRLLDEGVPNDGLKALTNDDANLVKSLKARNKKEREGQQTLDFGAASVADQARPWADTIAQIDGIDETSVDAVRDKERIWRRFTASAEARRATLAADTWCTAIVGPKNDEALAITTQTVRQAGEDKLDPAVQELVNATAAQYGFLHLHLAFPDQFQVPDHLDAAENKKAGWSGGFDVVLGNPPWERVKLQEKEWFATRDPEIAKAPNKAARTKLINALAENHPPLHSAFEAAVRQAEGESHFLLKSGAYPLCGRGDVNTYSVFAETMRTMTSAIGRVGVIVPTGIATDDTTKFYFQDLVEHRSLVSLFDFENRRQNSPDGRSAKWFDGVHSSYKFCLLTLSGSDRPIDEAEFVFFGDEISELADPDRRFTLTPEDFELLNPNTRTCPIFRTRRDAEITKGIYQRVPVLIKEGRNGEPDENPWGVKLSTMFHMSNDSHLFRTREQLESEGWTLQGNIFTRDDDMYLPLYEAKMLGFLDNRAADVVRSATAEKRQAQPATISAEEKQSPGRLALPLYWVPALEVDSRLTRRTKCLVGFRNVTSPTNERTMIPTMLPNVGVGHSEPVVVGLEPQRALLLAAIWSSYCFDFIARQKVGGVNFTYGYLQQIPVPVPDELDDQVVDAMAAISEELSVASWDLAPVGRAGLPYLSGSDRRTELMSELNALVFAVYGLSEVEVDRAMDHFPIVMRRDVAESGSFQTKEHILRRFRSIVRQLAEGRYVPDISPAPCCSSVQATDASRPEWSSLYSSLVTTSGTP